MLSLSCCAVACACPNYLDVWSQAYVREVYKTFLLESVETKSRTEHIKLCITPSQR